MEQLHPQIQISGVKTKDLWQQPRMNGSHEG